MITVRCFLIGCIILFCSGCLTPTASKQEELEAKQFRSDGKSYIYLMWPPGLMGAAIAPELNINGKIIGQISRGKYYLIVAEAREVNFIASLPVDVLSPYGRIAYFSCQPDQCKYLEGGIHFGACMSFREVDSVKGEKIIKSSNLIQKIVLE